jgi:hypothetical protein
MICACGILTGCSVEGKTVCDLILKDAFKGCRTSSSLGAIPFADTAGEECAEPAGVVAALSAAALAAAFVITIAGIAVVVLVWVMVWWFDVVLLPLALPFIT